MNFSDTTIPTMIPTKVVGPIRIRRIGSTTVETVEEDVRVSMATFETPLWYSTQRGAIVSQKSGWINTAILQDIMTRSIILEAADIAAAEECRRWILDHHKELAEVVERSGKYATLEDLHIEVVAKLLYVRFSISTGNASGHNMATKASDDLAAYITQNFYSNFNSHVRYVSVSGNYCVDKKVSAINGILGRGKRVCAEIIVKKDVCEAILKTNPEKICELNLKKNMLGSILAGSLRSANAHYANAILAIFLATGQDAANIVEASQGVTFAEMNGEDLYFSVTIPNLIVGTVGNGKNLDFARKNLEMMGCCDPENSDSSQRLASIIAAAVLCSELSLMAALTNPGELMRAHISLERNGNG